MPPRLPKCDKCNNSITKRLPGLECSKCDKIVHIKDCSGLSGKQASAIRNTSSLEWTCKECQESTPPRQSVVIPDDEEDEEEDEEAERRPGAMPTLPTINTKKLFADISNEVDRVINKRMREINASIEFFNAKIDEYTEDHKAMKQRISDVIKMNTQLKNENKHLETRIAALEQRHNELEQNNLAKTIEVSGLPALPTQTASTSASTSSPQDLLRLIKTVAGKLNLEEDGVKSCRKIGGKPDKPSTVIVKLCSEDKKIEWLRAARNTPLTIKDIMPSADDKLSQKTIYVRAALTRFHKELLWNAKNKLKEAGFKFVWISNGRILARKEEKSDIQYIRNKEDLHSVLSNK